MRIEERGQNEDRKIIIGKRRRVEKTDELEPLEKTTQCVDTQSRHWKMHLAERYKDILNLSTTAEKDCTPQQCLCVRVATLQQVLGYSKSDKEHVNWQNWKAGFEKEDG